MDTTFSHIKAVFCDIDGTLLTSQHTVSPRTVAAIRALRERGVLFGLCTGRDAHATEAMYELWGIEGLVDVLVGCGGAEVIDRAHDINELSYPLPGETIARICKHMADLPATPVCPRDGVFLRAREQCVRRAPVARRRRALPGGRFCRVLARAAAQGDVYHGTRGNAAGD